MAMNVYLTLFRKYNAQQLKALEWKYHLMCYGGPFVIAFALIFAETRERHKVYGDATVSHLCNQQLKHVKALTWINSYGAGFQRNGISYESSFATFLPGRSAGPFTLIKQAD